MPCITHAGVHNRSLAIPKFRLGIVWSKCDLSHTLYSSDTLNHLQSNNPVIVYNEGDLVSSDRGCDPGSMICRYRCQSKEPVYVDATPLAVRCSPS